MKIEKQLEFWEQSKHNALKINLANPLENDFYCNERVVSIIVEQSGKVCFQEECDECFKIYLSKQDAIKALQEAIQWIETNA